MTQKTETLESKVTYLAQTLGKTVQASVEQRVQATSGELKEEVIRATQVKHDEITAIVKDSNATHLNA
eukprot:1657193-Karenia_brevis.AAC.1